MHHDVNTFLTDNVGMIMNENANLVAQIVASYAARPDATVDDIVQLATRLTAELRQSTAEAQAAIAPVMRASSDLTAENAITNERIYCLCCGKSFTMLKRHLNAEHGLSEDGYREAFSLSADYPLVAPSYSTRKANYARSVGFGKYARNTVTVG